jgi:hypothetical protein
MTDVVEEKDDDNEPLLVGLARRWPHADITIHKMNDKGGSITCNAEDFTISYDEAICEARLTGRIDILNAVTRKLSEIRADPIRSSSDG